MLFLWFYFSGLIKKIIRKKVTGDWSQSIPQILWIVICPQQGNDLSRDTTKTTRDLAPSKASDQPGHPPSRISLRCPNEETLRPTPSIECTAKTFIRSWVLRLIITPRCVRSHCVGFVM